MAIPAWLKNLKATYLVSKKADGSINQTPEGIDFGLVRIIDSIKLSLIESQAELPITTLLGVDINDVIYESSGGEQEYDTFIFKQTETGGAVNVRVKLSADDAAYSEPISFVDMMVADPGGVRVVVTSGNTKTYALLGKFYQIQVSQAGATGSNIVGNHSVSHSGV